jgi:hypothetical protein
MYQIFQFCARFNQDLIVHLDKIWDRTAHPFVTRDTPTEFKPPVGPNPRNVLESSAFMLRYDKYWWNLTRLFIPVPIKGQHFLPSGVLVSVVTPDEAWAMLEKELELHKKALAAEQIQKRTEQDLVMLKGKQTKGMSKLKEMDKKIKDISQKISKVMKDAGENDLTIKQLTQETNQAIEVHSSM